MKKQGLDAVLFKTPASGAFEAADRTAPGQAVPARPRPSAEEWVQLHERLDRIARKCGPRSKGESHDLLTTCASDLCGLSLRRLTRGGPFKRCASELQTYAAEFLAAQLSGPGERGDDGRLQELACSMLVGFHPKIAEVRRTISRYVECTLPILVIGDRGTGKGVLAQVAAAVGAKRLYTIALSGVPDTLAESELFGHRKGAFTDAKEERAGILRTASERAGVVYLDDVAECSPELQAKLLTAFEEGIVRPVGSDEEFSIGPRFERRFNLISSCHPMSLHRLRPDLRDRLNTLPLWVPPLAERGADILLLASRAADSVSRHMGIGVREFSAGAQAELLRYSWPGNVRQLINVISRAIVLSGTRSTIGRGRIARTLDEEAKVLASDGGEQECEGGWPTGVMDEWPTLAEVGDRYIALVCEAVGGKVSEAARILGIDRSTVRRRRKGNA